MRVFSAFSGLGFFDIGYDNFGQPEVLRFEASFNTMSHINLGTYGVPSLPTGPHTDYPMWMDNYMKHGPVDAINNKDAPCGWMDRATPGPAVRGGPDILSWDPAAQDGRDPQYAKPITNFMRSAVAKSAYTKLAEIPADFDRFLPGTAVCTEETKVKLRSLFEDRRSNPGGLVGKFIRVLSHLSGYELYRKIKMKLLYSIGQLKMVTETANCGAPFLQSDIGGTNTYDILELAVWGHFMVEADPAGLVDLSSNTFWNHNVANDLTKPAHHLRHISAVCMQPASEEVQGQEAHVRVRQWCDISHRKLREVPRLLRVRGRASVSVPQSE